MDQRLHAILLAADVKGHWEFAPGHDYALQMARVLRLKPELESLLGVPLQVDNNVQDASFLTDLFTLDIIKGVGGYWRFCVRFSNFGNLAVVCCNSPLRRLDDYPIAEVEALLIGHGFQPVPAEALKELYDGLNNPNEYRGQPLTWWIRFFDYL